MAKNKNWFDLSKDTKRRYAKASWIPLRLWNSEKDGKWGSENYSDVFEGVHSIIVPVAHREAGEQYGWSDDHDHRAWVDEDVYHQADQYILNDHTAAVRPVLRQPIPGDVPAEWHLHQDLVIALGLQRIDDIWIRPAERSVQVARIRRNANGEPIALEIRAEYLRDYLSARRAALRIASYRERDAIVEDLGDIDFPENGIHEDSDDGSLFKRAWAVDESGMPYGGGVAVFRAWRTDIDQEDDVPVMGPENNDNTDYEHHSFTHEGNKLWRVMTEFRRGEWVEPAEHSPRVLFDDVPSGVSFIVEADGTRMNADELDNEDIGRWLWFLPNVVPSHLAQPGGMIEWYTKDTGGISTPYDPRVHFGLNESGLVTVYAYDIARLPEWERRHWAGFNVTPEGKVSAELLMAQVAAEPASTQSPEQFFWSILQKINVSFEAKFGIRLFRENEFAENIATTIHRFRSLDETGFLSLAKDIARLTADAIDVASLHKVAPPQEAKKLGSLKSLELLLSNLSDERLAHFVMGPIFAAYELRISDAHLPKTDKLAAYDLLGITENQSWMQKGFALLDAVVIALHRVNAILNGRLPTNVKQPQPKA